MPSQLLAVTFDAADPSRIARFWAQLLGRDVVAMGTTLLLPGDETQVGLAFEPGRSGGTTPHRLHLHLTSERPEDQQHTVDRALALGARHHDVGQLAEEGHTVLADPEGNELCVIPAGSSFLAGCGFLGEVACDGTREVGRFWSAALGWPLVWDQDQETAIQSPAGGTKVAWGGPPVAPQDGRGRQRFLLATDQDVATEAERLVSLGAARTGEDSATERIVLTDPDGNEFGLQALASVPR